MKIRWLIIATALFGVVAAGPALAAPKTKAKAKPQCVDQPFRFSWEKLLFGPAPGPNGCSPPVYFGSSYIGQDPDPFIRQQLLRDPGSGYATEFH